MEYSRMSSYVSNLIAANIGSINAAQKLADAANAYNLGILAVIGDNSTKHLPELRQNDFIAHCDSLKSSLTSASMLPLADSVLYSYSAYMLTTLELPQAILSDFINTREWYFDRLQPRYNRLRSDINILNTAIYNDLQKNSATFERGFYRSIIPGAVAVAVGLLLVLLLMFFLMAYYVNPIYRMLTGTFETVLPVLKKEKVAAYSFGLVKGAMQCQHTGSATGSALRHHGKAPWKGIRLLQTPLYAGLNCPRCRVLRTSFPCQ